jgi:hypothetical protein
MMCICCMKRFKVSTDDVSFSGVWDIVSGKEGRRSSPTRIPHM